MLGWRGSTARWHVDNRRRRPKKAQRIAKAPLRRSVLSIRRDDQLG
jgi:hypothetical protein